MISLLRYSRKDVVLLFISRKQLKLLNRISKGSVIRTDVLSTEDIEYLRTNELVSVTKYEKPGDYYYHPKITEKGKAFLYEKRSANQRANIALALSIAAIVISLLTAFTPFSDWCKAWISSIFPDIAEQIPPAIPPMR